MVVVQEKVEGRKRATGGGAWEGARVRVCKRGAAGDKKGAPVSGVGGPVVQGMREWAGSVGRFGGEKGGGSTPPACLAQEEDNRGGKGFGWATEKEKGCNVALTFFLFFCQLTGRYY
jgi:hypothetical protein